VPTVTDPSRWRDRLAPHASVLLALVLFAVSLLAARTVDLHGDFDLRAAE
jgi:hypothetical protein